MSLFKRLSRRIAAAARPAPLGRPGCRAYAIGDIHGRLDLLDQLLDTIARDAAARAPRETFIIFLGDLIDRGPESGGVVARLLDYRPHGMIPVFLAGNHEEMLLRILAGDKKPLSSWLTYGGSECLHSYGVAQADLRWIDDDQALALIRATIPPAHAAFLDGFGDTFEFGDYLFVHAGIRPGVALADQDRSDFRWIREPFLTDGQDHGFMVVHGHTIVGKVEERPNRIAIDTGAYQTGVLTALAVEDGQRWYLTADSRGLATASAA